MESRIAASLAEAQYAPLKIAVRKIEAKDPRMRIETGFDEDAPVGPSEAEEAGYLASGVSPEEASRSARKKEDENLPSMDELNRRLSPQVLDQIEELFRAKFTQVQRIPEEDLK